MPRQRDLVGSRGIAKHAVRIREVRTRYGGVPTGGWIAVATARWLAFFTRWRIPHAARNAVASSRKPPRATSVRGFPCRRPPRPGTCASRWPTAVSLGEHRIPCHRTTLCTDVRGWPPMCGCCRNHYLKLAVLRSFGPSVLRSTDYRGRPCTVAATLRRCYTIRSSLLSRTTLRAGSRTRLGGRALLPVHSSA